MPDEYVGKKLEGLIYAVEELSQNKLQDTMAAYKVFLHQKKLIVASISKTIKKRMGQLYLMDSNIIHVKLTV